MRHLSLTACPAPWLKLRCSRNTTYTLIWSSTSCAERTFSSRSWWADGYVLTAIETTMLRVLTEMATLWSLSCLKVILRFVTTAQAFTSSSVMMIRRKLLGSGKIFTRKRPSLSSTSTETTRIQLWSILRQREALMTSQKWRNSWTMPLPKFDRQYYHWAPSFLRQKSIYCIFLTNLA